MFFGGTEDAGAIQGLQAETARVPYANVGLMKLPDEISDDEAITLSDIFPTGYFGAELAQIEPGRSVAVFGAGPVGQFAIASAKLLGAGRIFAIDAIESRLDMAREQGAEAINFENEDPVEALRELTRGIGVDRAIDAVGTDANTPTHGPGAQSKAQKKQFAEEVKEIAPKAHPKGDNWHPGNAPSQALAWAVEALAKAGTLSIIGVYDVTARFFPIGKAVNKNLTMRMGNCHHRRYLPRLLDLVRTGAADPLAILTQAEPLTAALDAYKAFDTRQPGWIKIKLEPTPVEA